MLWTWGSTSRPGSIGCSTTANAPPVSAPETLNTTPMPPSQTERPSPGFTTIVGTSIMGPFGFVCVLGWSQLAVAGSGPNAGAAGKSRSVSASRLK